MATTVGNFSAIDDTEVDAESPITETLVTRMRDNSYWIDAGTRRTTETDTSKVLKPDGSGGVQWGAGGGGGAKGSGTMSIASGTPTQIAIVTNRVLRLTTFDSAGINPFILDIDNADDSYVGNSANGDQSGTVTGTFASFQYGSSGAYIWVRKVSTNYEFYISGGGASATNYYSYLWM